MRIRQLILVLSSLAAAAVARAEEPLPLRATGRMYVSSFGSNEVKVFDRDGSYLSSFTGPDVAGTRGIVATSDGRLFVSGEASNRISVFDVNGTPLGSFTAPGLSGPTGGAISPDGRYFVCSFNDDAIYSFSLDGTFLARWTPPGLDGPNCIAFLLDGTSFVSSALNDRVLHLDANGAVLADFTGGGLDSPMSVSFDFAGRLFVSGGLSNNVVVFDTSGSFLFALTHAAMSVPQGVAFDERHHLFVSNFSTHDVIEFDAQLAYLRTISAPGTSLARSIAFERLPLHVALRRGNTRGPNGIVQDVLRINAQTGNHHREVVAAAGGALSFALDDYPGAGGGPFRYVVYALARENGPADATALPRGVGDFCFATPITGGSAITVFNTLGREARIGSPVVAGTPLGPGEIFTHPRVRPGLAGRTFTIQGIVPDCCSALPASITNALVLRIQ
jgi:DNA-binding beta-propeller fold protein YncE